MTIPHRRRPHVSLGGETPMNRCRELTEQMPVSAYAKVGIKVRALRRCVWDSQLMGHDLQLLFHSFFKSALAFNSPTISSQYLLRNGGLFMLSRTYERSAREMSSTAVIISS